MSPCTLHETISDFHLSLCGYKRGGSVESILWITLKNNGHVSISNVYQLDLASQKQAKVPAVASRGCSPRFTPNNILMIGLLRGWNHSERCEAARHHHCLPLAAVCGRINRPVSLNAICFPLALLLHFRCTHEKRSMPCLNLVFQRKHFRHRFELKYSKYSTRLRCHVVTSHCKVCLLSLLLITQMKWKLHRSLAQPGTISAGIHFEFLTPLLSANLENTLFEYFSVKVESLGSWQETFHGYLGSVCSVLVTSITVLFSGDLQCPHEISWWDSQGAALDQSVGWMNGSTLSSAGSASSSTEMLETSRTFLIRDCLGCWNVKHIIFRSGIKDY